jgi:hypothetical protein
MPTTPIELRNIDIQWISLVKRGANNKVPIYKRGDSAVIQKQIDIRKYDDEKGVLYGIVYSPNETDLQGEFANAHEIEKASYAFMKSANARNIDKNHSENPEEAFVAESWITREHDALFKNEPLGSWAVGIKLESDELKKQAKDGDIQGLSMGGFGDRVVGKAATYNDKISVSRMWDRFHALESSIESIIADDEVTDKKAAVSESIDQFKSDMLESSGIGKSFFSMLRKIFKPKLEDDMDKNQVQEAINKSIKALPTPITKEDVGAIVKGAMEEALKPVIDRIEKIENASPGTGQDPGNVKKGDKPEDLIEHGRSIGKMFNEQMGG